MHAGMHGQHAENKLMHFLGFLKFNYAKILT